MKVINSECCLSGHYVDFGEEIQTQNVIIYNINQVIIQSQKYVFFFHNFTK